MQDLVQILELFTTSNPSKAFLSPKQSGGCPTQNHSWAVPALAPAGPVGGLGKTVLDKIGVGQSPAERMTNAQSLDRKGFFQAFQQAGRRHGRETIQPPGSFAQLFLGDLGIFLTPSGSQAPGGLGLLF